MNNWKQFLSSQDARGPQADLERVSDFGSPLTVDAVSAGFVSVITDQGLIAANGEEAASFLHKQLSNDVEHLPAGAVRLAGYCTAKGRLLATFQMWRQGESIVLQLPRDIQAVMQKRLQMFILRAKVRLQDITAEPANEVMLGFGGKAAQAVLQAQFGALPATPDTVLEHRLGTLLRLTDAFGAPRFQWLTSAEAAQAAWPTLCAGLAKGGDDAWQLAAIHAGVAQIGPSTQEQFVPQMINLELLGGVNFKKGCYPGQEIVARSQYLGKLKRRTALARIAQAVALPGQEVYATDDPEQPCGMVVNAAPNGAGGSDVLVEMKLAALDGDVHLGAASGAALQFLPMPYPLDALDI